MSLGATHIRFALDLKEKFALGMGLKPDLVDKMMAKAREYSNDPQIKKSIHKLYDVMLDAYFSEYDKDYNYT